MPSCPPVELVSHIIEQVAFSGYSGLSLAQVWSICGDKLGHSPDEFMKSVLWQWLFFSPEFCNNLIVWKNDSVVSIGNERNYVDFINRNNEDVVRIYPSSETQWKYLTGTEFSKKAKLLLGEFPFQLLCEIAKHGSSGIYASELSKATDQDPRSLTIRLRKLEELDYIQMKKGYNEASYQHSSLCVHKKFAKDEVEFLALEFGDDLERSRDTQKLKELIMLKTKLAPNGLRSLTDLKVELSLGSNLSISKFYRGIVEWLCKKGYLEKVMVKSPESGATVYCVKFISDIANGSGNGTDNSDLADVMQSYNDVRSQNDDGTSQSTLLPKYNLFFPIINQMYHQIDNGKPPGSFAGPTSMDVSRAITGGSDFRPLVRLLEATTSFVKDHESFKKLKKYDDPYPGVTITRVYDFEGKFKFYRYFGDDNEPSDSYKPSNKKNIPLNQLNKKLYTKMGKHPQPPLVKLTPPPPPATKLNKRGVNEPTRKNSKRLKTKEIKSEDEDTSTKATIETAPVSIPSKATNDTSSSPTTKPSTNPSTNPLLDTPLAGLFQQKPAKTTKKYNIPKGTSIKSVKRREALIEIIKASGGVTYTSALMCRELDKRLDASTATDMKTLVRDIAFLVHTNDLEARDIKSIKSGQPITRKLLILTNEQFRPSQNKIDQVCKECEEDEGRKFYAASERRVIEADVTIYHKPPEKPKRRLTKLSDSSSKPRTPRKKATPSVKSEDVPFENITADSEDPLKSLVGTTRRKKPPTRRISQASSRPAKGVRKSRTIEFTREDSICLFKAVVIYRTFKRSLINFDDLTSLFGDITGKDLRQKWTSVRKSFGGLTAVLKAIETFEYIVKRGIEDGTIGLENLENFDLHFFLGIWDDSDAFALDSTYPLMTKLEENYENYKVVYSNERAPILFEQIEGHSMRQKEIILSNNTFYYNENQLESYDKETEGIISAIRSICTTEESNFTSAGIIKILGKYNKKKVHEIVQRLIKDKELMYDNDGSTETRFTFTEKFQNVFVDQQQIPSMLKDANHLYQTMSIIFGSSKALLLSQALKEGHMMALMSCISNYNLDLIHIDKPYKFNGYESRLIDKNKLECDLIVTGEKMNEDDGPSIPVPGDEVSSHVWLDMKGNINTEIWTKIIVSVIYYVLYRPGIQIRDIYSRFKSGLSRIDLEIVIEWLKASKCLQQGKYNDYWLGPQYYHVLG